MELLVVLKLSVKIDKKIMFSVNIELARLSMGRRLMRLKAY